MNRISSAISNHNGRRSQAFILAVGMVLALFGAVQPTNAFPIILAPQLSSPSVKNGEFLSVTVSARSLEPIVTAMATIEGIDQSFPLKLVSGNEQHGVWMGIWRAHSLQEKTYTITLTFTDALGFTKIDRSLRFTDPLFGNSDPGLATNTATESFARVDAMTLNAGNNSLWSGVIDSTGTYAYFGLSLTPSRIAKVQLSTMTQVDELVLDAGDNDIFPLLIDPTDTYLYTGTYTSAPVRVIKISLSSFTRTAAIDINDDLDVAWLYSGVIDPAGNFAYFGSESSPDGKIIKIDLSDFTYAASLTFDRNDVPRLYLFDSATIDPAGNFAYFGTWTVPGRIAKVQLSDFSHVGTLELASGEDLLTSAVMGANGDYAYFGTSTSTGKIIRIQLSDFSHAGTLTMDTGIGYFLSAVADPTGNFLYFPSSTGAPPVTIVQVRQSDFSVADSITLEAAEKGSTYAAVINPDGGYSYYGISTSPGTVVRALYGATYTIQAYQVELLETAATIDAFNFYSHLALGNLRLALYDSSKDLVWESGVMPNSTASDWVSVTTDQGTPTTLTNLPSGTYWLAFQTSNPSAIASVIAGTNGDGFSLDQSFGAFPVSIAGETTTDTQWSFYVTYSTGGVPAPDPGGDPGGGGGTLPTITLTMAANPTILAYGPGAVVYTYTITNPGDWPLYSVAVTDDHFGELVLTSGDANDNNILEPDETWIYIVEAEVQDTTTNTATVIGNFGGSWVSDTATLTVVVNPFPIVPPPGTGGEDEFFPTLETKTDESSSLPITGLPAIMLLIIIGVAGWWYIKTSTSGVNQTPRHRHRRRK